MLQQTRGLGTVTGPTYVLAAANGGKLIGAGDGNLAIKLNDQALSLESQVTCDIASQR